MNAFDSHRGHLELAWECLNGVPFEVGVPRFAWAFLVLLAERMSPGLSFETVIERYPELLNPGLVAQHYLGGELSSARARAVFVLPSVVSPGARVPPG